MTGDRSKRFCIKCGRPNQDSSRQAIVTSASSALILPIHSRMSKSGLEPTGDCDSKCWAARSPTMLSACPNQDSSRQAIVTLTSLALKTLRICFGSKSGLEPTGDCDRPRMAAGFSIRLPSKSGLEPTGDCDPLKKMVEQAMDERPNQDSSRQAIVTIIAVTPFQQLVNLVQIRTRADRRL